MKGPLKSIVFLFILLFVISPSNSFAQDADDKVYDVVEVMPRFPGGDSALFVFLGINTDYPVEAKLRNIKGTVYVKFVIDTNGNAINAVVAKKLDPSLDAAAIAVIKKMPRWSAGLLAGKKVKVSYVLPFKFNVVEVDKPISISQVIRVPKPFEKETNEVFALLKKDNTTEALNYADKLVAENPKAVQVYAARASVYLHLREYDSACADIHKAYELGDAKAAAMVDKYCERRAGEQYGLVILKDADIMPEFPGGQAALSDFLSHNVYYPVKAKSNEIEGTVYVQFVVDTAGGVTRLKIARGVEPSLDAEALRVVSSIPKWNPGMKDGKPVNIKYTVPIRFKLH